MKLRYPEHPLRQALTAELHVRNFEPLRAPAQVAHLAYLSGPSGTGANVLHLQALLRQFGVEAPQADPGQYFFVDLGNLRLRWERHTEFVTYTLTRSGAFDRPFAYSPLDDLPADWLAALPGKVVTTALLALEPRETPERSQSELMSLFDDNPVLGSEVAGGNAIAWTDLRIDPDGYGRILVRDVDLSDGQAGRLVKRILDINAYRAMALLGLPLARQASRILTRAERRLADVAVRMRVGDRSTEGPEGEGEGKAPPERRLLAELTALAAEIESVAARTASRFDASRAYYQVITQRLSQLREGRIQGLQTLSEFLDARLAPAIATCIATDQRQQSLADRAARMTALLRARVEVQLQEQNRSLLDSMDRRARLQLRLQQTVEGLSVVAIGYYGVGLVGYLIKGLEAGGLAIDAELAIAAAVPVVIGIAWLGLRHMKRQLHRDEGA
jgi:uncharacterized membrane-anchored protein